MELQIKNLVSR